jgi:hypothetical protein
MDIVSEDLIELIKNEKQVQNDEEKRQLYITYAGLFTSDLSENLYLTSIELDEKYGTKNANSWLRFLKLISVRSFIDGFVLEKQKQVANKATVEGTINTGQAIKLREQIDKKDVGDDNSNIVVMFLPQKDYLDI